MLKHEYLKTIQEAGFREIRIVDESYFPLECMANDATAKAIINKLEITPERLNEIDTTILSIKVTAKKPLY